MRGDRRFSSSIQFSLVAVKKPVSPFNRQHQGHHLKRSLMCYSKMYCGYLPMDCVTLAVTCFVSVIPSQVTFKTTVLPSP